jgi:hypothetical protein
VGGGHGGRIGKRETRQRIRPRTGATEADGTEADGTEADGTEANGTEAGTNAGGTEAGAACGTEQAVVAEAKGGQRGRRGGGHGGGGWRGSGWPSGHGEGRCTGIGRRRSRRWWYCLGPYCSRKKSCDAVNFRDQAWLPNPRRPRTSIEDRYTRRKPIVSHRSGEFKNNPKQRKTSCAFLNPTDKHFELMYTCRTP